MRETEAQASGELTLDEAFDVALRAHQADDLTLAETLYCRIIAAAPDHSGALHLLGILRYQTHRHREAISLLRRAIAVASDDAGMHSNLGNVLLAVDRPDLAVQAYRTAIELDASNSEARNNLGVALRVLNRSDEAEAVYREALVLHPEHRDVWDNLGRLLAARGRIPEAIACHARALELQPYHAGTRRHLVAAYGASGEIDRALELLRQWLRDEPDSPSAQHLHAALSGHDVPDRASERYVRELFDAFAGSFDQKLARLEYRVPDLIAAAVAAAYPVTEADLTILDAGCGTGLCGPALRPYARSLTGVDLSEKMLERAAARGTYDAVEQCELTRYLKKNPGAFDVVISADTLCYFGCLRDVFAAMAGALRPGGRLVFTVEEAEEPRDFTLGVHGRYGHTRKYVGHALTVSDLLIGKIEAAILRVERGEPVYGLVVTAESRRERFLPA